MKGFILIFDLNQNIQQEPVFLKFAKNENHGSICSMDISYDLEHLVAGHVDGTIVFWSLKKKSIIK